MTGIMMDGKPLKVGDEVYCLDRGKQELELDWLDTSKACNLDDPECEACQ